MSSKKKSEKKLTTESDSESRSESATAPEAQKKKKRKKGKKSTPKNPYEYFRELNDEEKAGVDAMRERLKGTPWESAGEDVGQLLRFLRARDYDPDKSHPMLVEALEWFEKYNPQEIKPEDCGDELKTAKYLMLGKDKEGRPIVAYRSGRHTPGRVPLENSIKSAHYMLQEAMRHMDTGVEKINLIFDREGFIRKCFDPPFLKELANTFEKMYPERVEKIFVREVNWLFWITFKIAKVFLPTATASKIVLLGSDTKKDLLNYIDEDQLWVRYGGTWRMPENYKAIFGVKDGDEDGSIPVVQYKPSEAGSTGSSSSISGSNAVDNDDNDEEPQEEVVC